MSEKLALTPYDVAVLTAAGQGLLSGAHRAQHPERAGEPALERGIGQGLTAALGHLAGAVPAAYLTRGAGPLASGAAATLAGLAGGALLPAVTQRAGHVGGEMTGGPVRTAAALAKLAIGTSCSYTGSMGDGTACPQCKRPHAKPAQKMGNYTYNATEPLPKSVSLSAAAQPPPGSLQSMDSGMGSMGFPPKPKKPKEAPKMKSETKAEERAEKPAEKDASADMTTFMSGFMGKWRAAAGKTMAEKVALYGKSGFNSMMKRSVA